MRASPMLLLALFPWMPEPAPAPAAAPCALAIEIHVRAPLAIGRLELHVMTGGSERVWAPYGVTFCWSDSIGGSRGLEVRVRVLVAAEATPMRARSLTRTF